MQQEGGAGEQRTPGGMDLQEGLPIRFINILEILKMFRNSVTSGDSKKRNLKVQVKKIYTRECNYSPLYSFRVNYVQTVTIIQMLLKISDFRIN